MDELTFVTEVVREDAWNNFTKSRNIVRAHVMRKHWQELKKSSRLSQLKSSSSSSSETDTESAPENFSGTRATGDIRCGHARKTVWPVLAKRPLAPRAPNSAPCQPFWHASDPFYYAGIDIDSSSTRLFQHYSTEFKALLSNQIQPVQIERPSICCTEATRQHSPALLHAICFQAAGHIAVMGTPQSLRHTLFNNQNTSCRAEIDTLYHRAATLGTLSSLLSSPEINPAVLETLILCIAILLAAEAMMGDHASLEAHTQGLRCLVKASGGIHALSVAISSQIQLADIKAAIAQRRAPSFRLQHHMKQRAQIFARLQTPITPTDPIVASFGLGFLKPSMQTRLCPALLQCISHTRHLTLAVSRMSIDRQKLNTLEIDDFISLDHSLLSLRDHTHNTFEECIRLALLVFSNSALWRVPPYFNWIISLATELKSALLLIDWHATIEEYSDLFLWISLLGRYTARTSSAVNCRWWSDKVREAAVVAGVTSWKDARLVVSTFAYVDRIYGPVWKEIWREAFSGKRSG